MVPQKAPRPAMKKIILNGMFLGLFLAMGSQSAALDIDRSDARKDVEEGWYSQTTASNRPSPQAIIHQKAQARARQRMARLESMSWYGMSNSRPTAAGTPFTSLYSPTWQAPGGRPFAWYHGRRSSGVIFR